MKLSSLLNLNALVFIGFGIAFALYGPIMIALFGVLEFGQEGAGLYWYTASFARLFGAALFGFGFLIWAARQLLAAAPMPMKSLPNAAGIGAVVSSVAAASAGSASRRLAFTLLFANAFCLFVVLTQQFTVWFTPAGWFATALFSILTLGYVFFLVTSKG